MAEFWWIKVCLCVILVPPFTAATDQQPSSLVVVVGAGGEVTLLCGNRTNDGRCDGITWTFSRSPKAAAEELIELGQIKHTKSKSDRLSVTANCSLVIKKVTVEDAGLYSCRQFRSEKQQENDSRVYLYVISMTEQKDDDKVTLSCSVSSFNRCRHSVKWLFEGEDVDREDQKRSRSGCRAKATFRRSGFMYESVMCRVTGKKSGNVQQFTFSPRKTEKNKRASADKDATTTPKERRWVLTAVATGSAVLLLITALMLVRWRRNKGNQAQMDLIVSDVKTDDDPEGVSYASIKHTEKSNSKAKVRGGDETVTYATVKPSCSSSSSSADPGNLYATVN